MADKILPAVYPTNTFEDLSGVSTDQFDNPYDALIAASNDDPKQLQTRYKTHRETRNNQQKGKLLSPDFPGVSIDPILLRLIDQSIEPGYVDPRDCFVFWARPPQKVKELIYAVQQKLLEAAPSLWLMPQNNLHMTSLEVTHSKTAPEIAALVERMRPGISGIVNHTQTHRPRLLKPAIGYDASAIALNFIPAAGEGLTEGRTAKDDAYSYHHFRRDLYSLCEQAGTRVDSRYVVPSAHLTIGRFITTKDFAKDDDENSSDMAKMKRLVDKIEEINAWLQAEYWPSEDGSPVRAGGEWIIGSEKGLDSRMGKLWYGGGQTVELGKGF